MYNEIFYSLAWKMGKTQGTRRLSAKQLFRSSEESFSSKECAGTCNTTSIGIA